MHPQVLDKRKQIKNVMNVVRYMTRPFSIITMFNADIAEELVMLNKFGNYKLNGSDANSAVGTTDIDVVR